MADILLVVGVTLLVALVFGEAFERVGIPALVGEIAAGLVLGPSAVGLIEYSETFAVFGTIGAMLLFFDIGYEHLDLAELLAVGPAAVSIALFGMIVPAGAGVSLGLAFGHGIAGSAFLALALSVTSIAVTARTLLDLDHLDSRVGHRVVGAAVVDDILGFVAFALLLLAVAGNGSGEVAVTIEKVVAFFAVAVIARAVVVERLSALLARSRQLGVTSWPSSGYCFSPVSARRRPASTSHSAHSSWDYSLVRTTDSREWKSARVSSASPTGCSSRCSSRAWAFESTWAS